MTEAAKKPKRKKLARKAPTDPGGRFLYQMGRYMKSRGWNVLVAGPIGIVRGVDSRHQLVINFLGAETQKAAR